MGRRKRVESAKTAEMRRNQGEDRGRGSMGVCSPSRSNNKNSSIQAPSGGGGGSDHVSRRGSFAVRGGDMAREHTSKHLSRNQPRSGSSFRRPPQQQGVGGGPPPNSTLNFVPPSQQYQLHSSHQPYPCAPQQEQQPYPQGIGFPSTAHLMNLSNGQACGNDGSARHHHNGSIQPGEFSGNPLVARLNGRLLFTAVGATQEPQQQHAPYPSSPGYDRNLNWSTQNGQGQPYPPYCGSHSFLPQQFTTVRNLPPLPYVMTPQGMMAPPPLYLLPMQGSPLMAYMPPQQQQQQEHCEHQDKSNREAPLQHNAMNGNVMPASPLAPYGSQQHVLLDRPQVVSPQPTLVRHPSFLAEKSTATRVAPTAAPPTAADPPAAATAAGCILLPRTQSILNRVSSFRKAAQPASKGDQARQEEVHMQQRLYAREQERLRLQQEMHAREAANKAAREERLHKLLQRQPSRNFAQESTRNAAPRVLMESPKSSRVSSDNASEGRPAPPSEPVLALKQASSARSSSTHPTTDVPASSQESLDHRLPMSVARLHSPAGSHVSRGSLGMAASSSGATAVIAKGKGPSGDASTATAVVDVPAAPAVGTQKLWHRCPSLVLYEIPLRCAKTVTGKGEEQIDCSTFPVRLVGSRLRVIDAAKQTTTEYAIDEIVTHRQGSTFVESKLFQQVGEVLVAGYSASVLSLDSKGLAKPVSAFDSAAWLAKQRLLRNLIGTVKNMQSTYSKEVGSRDFFEAAFSFALVKKVSAKKAAEWNTTNRATSQRGYEVVDLLQTEPTVVQLKMHSSVLFGHRLDGVEYRALRSESEFTKALASAQANANIVLGRLADAVAADPNDEAAAREQTSVFQVVTCVLTHCKAGAVSLQEQMTEPAEAVYKREAESDVISSDDEDDANAFGAFQSHNVPSACSDIIMNCLTCIGAQQSHDLWTAALEHSHGMAPTSLFDTAFGGPAYTVVLASMDPTKVESAETLVTQSAMSMKLHRRPLNGSARRLIRTSKYMTAVLQKKLNRANCPSGPQQRSWMADICKYAETLDSLRKVLRSVEATRLSVSGSA
ncbi:hypothetical protein, unknown function [Leishmania mexicana MHOM/GT/2001/U1103]|uniref:Uncharacterized protein n=1 Tax=Leishmania mexicana (strain MHOM/GT/2001/U1103) TaxID=929439 RepID=E9B4E1_LEIMU|nr:hypothetical protein, unknown function [Leishmania mexicana MHOM/GT/2001/U1103]CBZ30109.1 hypothetical protein, unknown function [Leishmania mexicana MHOM/GT/2001/U1103]